LAVEGIFVCDQGLLGNFHLCHNHLRRSALPKESMQWTPSPPRCFGRQSELTSAV
jgi:hypothetical protein